MRLPFLRGAIAAAGLTMAVGTAYANSADDLPKVTYEKMVLDNGLIVLLSVDKSAPVVSTFTLYHVGSKNERSDRTGFAHFFEHLMFEGTANIPRHTIDKYIQEAGGNLNAYTSFDETGYQINLPANELPLALWIESERMLHAKVEEIGVETQRGVVKEERSSRFDNQPYGTILEKIVENVGAGTPYAWPPIGSSQYIDQATIEEFRDFYKTYYVPNNAVLAIVGDIDIEKTKKMVREYFSGIPRGAEVKRPKFAFDFNTGGKSVDVVEEHTPLPALLYAWRTPQQGSADAYALEFLTTILAGGESSRMYRTLVDEKRAALQAQAIPFALESGGLFSTFVIGANPAASLDELGKEVQAIVEDVKEEGVTEQEFEKAKNQIETQYASRFNSVLDKAQALASAQIFFNDPERVNTEIEKYRAVTRQDVQRVARKYLTDENRTTIRYVVPGGE